MNDDNLKPFSKGTSGNPKGRPKGSKNFATVLKGYLQCRIEEKDIFTGVIKKFRAIEVMVLKQIAKAMDGDLNAVKWIANRADGKARQEQFAERPKDNKIIIEIVGGLEDEENKDIKAQNGQ